MHSHQSSRKWIHSAARLAALPALALLAMIPDAVANAQTTYTVTAIPPPNPKIAGHAFVAAINANGDMAGNDVFDSTGTQGALIKGGKETKLTANPGKQNENPPFVGAEAFGINNNDQAVGWAWIGNPNLGGDPEQRAVVWQAGGTVGTNFDLTHFPFCQVVQAEAINNLGMIAGRASECGPPLPNIAWVFHNGTFTNLPNFGGGDAEAFALNDIGQVVGDSDFSGGPTHAFLWQAGKGMTDLGALPGALFSQAMAINKNGVAVGNSDFVNPDGTLSRHPVVFQNGTVIDLTPDDTTGVDGFAAGINSSGQIVGSSLDHAFIWVNGVGTDLNTLIPANSGVTLGTANAINDKGQIAAQGTTSTTPRGGSQIFLLTPKS